MTTPASKTTPTGLYGRKVTRVPATPDTSPQLACPVCEETAAELLYEIEACSGRLFRCRNCGTGRVDPLPDAAELAGYYADAYYGEGGRKFNRFFELLVRLIAARHLRFLVRRVPPGGRVLDIGCGRGTLLSGLADRGLEVHGTEINAAAAAGADPRASIRIAPSLAAAAYPENNFDQVIIWHVLEHLPDPRETLLEVHRILRPGGEVIIAVPNFSSWQAVWAGPDWFHLDLPRHLYHFPREALRLLLQRCGFTCRSEHHFSLRQNPFGWVQSGLNTLPGLPRNGLYQLLLHQPGRTRPAYSLPTRLLCYAALTAGLPLGLAVELLATAFRRGATIHVVAAKRPR